MNEGERIKKRREELNMTQEELATKLGYKSRSSINKIELGYQHLTQRKIAAIASALDVSALYILGIEEEPRIDWEIKEGTFGGIERIMPELSITKKERALLVAFRNADEVTKKNICKILEVPDDEV